MTSRHALTTAATVLALTGGVTAAIASGGGRDHPEDDGTATVGTTTTTTATTTPARAPRITDIEVDDDAPAGKLRLEAEVKARGASVTSVRFTYRGETFTATRNRRDRSEWFRVVTADPEDLVDDAQITLRVRACAGDRCSTRTARDDA